MKKINSSTNARGINLIAVLIFSGILILVAAGTILIHLYISKKNQASTGVDSVNPSDDSSTLTLIRGNDLKLINKLYLADIEKESAKYLPLKKDLFGIIGKVIAGSVKSVAVYFRDLNDGSWISINGDDLYYPGSLTKVPIMIYYFQQEQEHKGTLNKELVYEKPKVNFPSQFYKGDSILNGGRYRISELLKYMIVESDNNATHLLSQKLKNDAFCKIFNDLEIPPDSINDVNYQISARNYSKFFRILYSSSYLPRNYSEYALELLSESKFDQGISKNIPQGIIVAHKFGEYGQNSNMDFSETAIVYRDNGPYLLTIMTRGTNARQQANAISKIADEVYGFLTKSSTK